MAMICTWGPVSGRPNPRAIAVARAGRRVFQAAWVVPYWVAQLAGAIAAALFLQAMFGHVSAGRAHPTARLGGDRRSLVLETVLAAILVSVIFNLGDGKIREIP